MTPDRIFRETVEKFNLSSEIFLWKYDPFKVDFGLHFYRTNPSFFNGAFPSQNCGGSGETGGWFVGSCLVGLDWQCREPLFSFQKLFSCKIAVLFFFLFTSLSIWMPDWANFKIPRGSGTAFLPLRYSLPHYLTASALVSPADGIQFPFHSQQPRIISLIHLETQWSLPLRMQTLSQSNLLIFRTLFLAFHSLTPRLGCCIFILGKELTWLLGTQWKTLLQNPKIDMISYILLCLYKYCTS